MPEHTPQFAFIGYDHRDLAIAEELQHYLEHYKISSRLRKQVPGLPQNLRPVYLAKNDLSIRDMGDELKKVVAATKFYIVICSKYSALPNEVGKHWVNDGLAYFIDKNSKNRERIIPVIHRDPPAGDDDPFRPENLMPESIRGILGADIGLLGKERAFSDVAAALLGVPPDALWQRHEREKRKQKRNRRIAAAIAAACAGAAGLFCYDYFAEHTHCYANYTERNNLPVGLGRLSGKEVAQRQYHYRFTEQRYKVRKVERCNSAGFPCAAEEPWDVEKHPCGVTFEYDENGNISKATHYDINRKPRTTLEYGGTGTGGRWSSVVFKPAQGEGVAMQFASFLSQCSRNWTLPDQGDTNGIAWLKLSYDDAGYIRKAMFMNNSPISQTPIPDARGVYGEEYGRDALGRITTITFLDESGNAAGSKTGQGGMLIEYDGDSGLISRVTNVDFERKPIENDDQWAEVVIQYDDKGNPFRCEFRDAKGDICQTVQGISVLESSFDERGNNTVTVHKDASGRVAKIRDSYAQTANVFNGNGLIIERKFLGIHGEPCQAPEQFSSIRYEYNAKGQKTTSACFDTNGKRCYNVEHISKVVHEYTPEGYVQSESFFDPDDKLCQSLDGYAKRSLVYNERGEEIERAFFNENGEPVRCAEGYAKLTIDYGADQETVTLTYYDEEGRICRIKDGYAKVRGKADRSGKFSSVDFLDENGKLVHTKLGYARITCAYDTKGNYTDFYIYDERGYPCTDSTDSHHTHADYDSYGRIVRIEYRGTDGAPCRSAFGFAVAEITYDRYGKVVATALYNEKGVKTTPSHGKTDERVEETELPFPNENGIAKVRKFYDKTGVCVKTVYLGKEGYPLSGNAGVTRQTVITDSRGNVLEVEYRGPSGELALGKNGFAIMRMKYDDKGNTIEVSTIGADGQPGDALEACPMRRKQYDANGRETEISYHNASGDLLLNSSGYAKMTKKYDGQGNEVECCFYDTSGKPCRMNDGGKVARIARVFNAEGKQTEECYFDTDGSPSCRPDKVSKVTFSYDSQGNERQRCYYDLDGKLLFTK